MATTTNFGWETPDDTDLVKDGALAMRTLGNAIDASLVDLKGGTTGQVLSKNSNTDMDFTWVTSDDANAIQNAIVDAKGDLITATAADTPARLAVGNNGETLVADSSASVGLRYQEPKAQNPIVNSSFQVWQRGTSFSVSAFNAYTADRWMFASGNNTGRTVSRQTTSDTTNLPNIQYCARVQRNSGNTATSTEYFGYNLETIDSIPFAGKTVTLSFYARRGANFSASSNLLKIVLATGTGTDQNILTSGFTGVASPVNTTATLTTSWQRFSFTATLATNLTQIGLYFAYDSTGTAGAADFFEVTAVQLEVGSVATPFKTYAATLAGELAACQRYYQLVAEGSTQIICNVGAYTSGSVYGAYAMKTTMRTTPTISQVSGTNYFVLSGAGIVDAFDSIDALTDSSPQQVRFGVTAGISVTQGYAYWISSYNANTRLALQAEL